MAPDHDHPSARETRAEEGAPVMEHNQWTFEGEIERLGAFSHGASRARGPARWLAVALVVMMVLPLVAGLVSLFTR